MTKTSTAKSCVACGKALDGQPRMKDSQSRYWCMDCGAEDQRKKLMSSGGGNACGGCGEQFPAHQLSKFGSQRLCSGCIRTRTKGPGLKATLTGMFSGGGPANTGNLYKLLALMVVMIALVIWRYATL